MKLFVYSMREFDEKQFFDLWCEKQDIAYEYTTAAPSVENADLAKGYDAISVITTPITAEILKVWKECGVKCVSTRTVGYDHVDMKAAKDLGIAVCNAPYPPDSVANYAIMLMLMCCRKVSHILTRSAVQDYSLMGKMGKEISNCTIGVIGTGKIGKTVIKHLQGFGCRILAFDLYPAKEIGDMAEYVDLDTLYKESDIITLHMPATDENFHMIDKAALSKMKDGVMLINTARGSLIDSNAMIEGLESGKIGAAGLDVIENETSLYYFNHMGQPMDNRELALLKALPNVVVTPHTAFYTDEAVEHMVRNSITGCMKVMSREENPFLVG